MGLPYITDLFAIEDAIFVADILSKTRSGGLPWVRLRPDRYTLTLCEPAECASGGTNDMRLSNFWRFFVGRNRTNDGTFSYNYYIDVMLDEEPYMSIDSRQTSYVEQLFRTIELSLVTEWRIDSALDFISQIPTSPSSWVNNFVMCGGVELDGIASVSIISSGGVVPSGAVVNGSAVTSTPKFGNASLSTSSSFVDVGNVVQLIANATMNTSGSILISASAYLQTSQSIAASAQ